MNVAPEAQELMAAMVAWRDLSDDAGSTVEQAAWDRLEQAIDDVRALAAQEEAERAVIEAALKWSAAPYPHAQPAYDELTRALDRLRDLGPTEDEYTAAWPWLGGDDESPAAGEPTEAPTGFHSMEPTPSSIRGRPVTRIPLRDEYRPTEAPTPTEPTEPELVNGRSKSGRVIWNAGSWGAS